MMVMLSRMMHHAVHHALPHRHHCSMRNGRRLNRPDLQPGQTLKSGAWSFIKLGLTLKGKLPNQPQQNTDHQQPTAYRG